MRVTAQDWITARHWQQYHLWRQRHSTIHGGGGNDFINTGSGSDSVFGEGGNTTIIGGSGNDTIWAGDGNDSWANSISTESTLIQLGDGDTYATGAGGNDTLIGGSGNDTIMGGDGNESLVGGVGNTTIVGGSGGDGTDTIIGGSGNDSISVGSIDTTVTGGTGTYIIQGGSGNDVLAAGEGGTGEHPTEISAGDGSTTIIGGSGVDAIWGGGGSDVISAGDGGDDEHPTQITAGSGSDSIYAGGGVDSIIGGDGSASVYGGNGTEYVSVGSGDMNLYSGSGINVYNGGKGNATYEIEDNGGTTTIWNSSAGDTLTFGSGVGLADISSASEIVNGTLVVNFTLDDGTLVVLQGGDVAQVGFGDGIAIPIAELLSPEFSNNGTNYITGTQATTGNNIVGVQINNATAPLVSTPGAQKQTSVPTPENFVLMGMADLSFTGDTSNDVIHANGGSDTLIAGSGSDTLVGGGVSDLYVASSSDATTTIQGSSGSDTLAFNAGTTASNLTVSTTAAQGGSLVVTLQNTQGGSVVIDAPTSASILDSLNFADGSSASLGRMLAQLTSGPTATTASANATLASGIQNMSLTGSANLIVTANTQDNVIKANAGNDTLVAGSGEDTLIGGAGHTTYDLSASDGNVVVQNSNSGDILNFDGSVSENNLTTSSTVINGQTIVTISDADGGSTTIKGGGLNQINFADGSTASLAQLVSPGYTEGGTAYSQVNATAGSGVTSLVMTGNAAVSATANSGNDTLISNASNDTLIAGTGNDTLFGDGASDTYVIANGSQTTTVDTSGQFDVLEYGIGITASNLSASEIVNPDGTGTVTVANTAGGKVVIGGTPDSSVDTIFFADGSTTSVSALLAEATSGPSAAKSVVSVTLGEGIRNMSLTGGASVTATGNELADVITANSGNDTLVAGLGNDTLVGSAGTTTYRVVPQTGDVTIQNSNANDILAFGGGITQSDLAFRSTIVNGQTVVSIIDDQGGAVTIQGGGLTQLSFSDGSTATLSQLLSTSYTAGSTLYTQTSVIQPEGTITVKLTGSANITATGNDQNGTLQANSGNDTLIAGTGNDTMIGGGTSTIYEVPHGSGTVTIENNFSGDTILVTDVNSSAYGSFAAASTAADGSTTVTLVDPYGANIVVQDYGSGAVDTVQFGDGSIASLAEMVAQSNNSSTASNSAINVTLPGGIQNETLIGTANLVATGNDIPDVIHGNSGNDTLIAGSVNDTLVSGGGVNTYEVADSSTGVGNVVIKGAGNSDTLIFEDGATVANLSAASKTVNGTAVTIITDSKDGETVTLSGSTLNNISLSGGATATVSQLLAPSYITGTTEYAQGNATAATGVTTLQLTGSGSITGTANGANDVLASNVGNDTLVAGTGTDTLVGGVGETTYAVGTSSGATIIANSNGGDTISFGSGITLANLSATAATDGSGNVTITDSAAKGITVSGTSGNQLDKLVFADGSTGSLNYLLAQVATGPTAQTSATNVIMQGNIRNLSLTGSGNLIATGNYLPDLINANSGNDTLNAGTANDTLVAGTGNDVLSGNGGTSVVTYALNYSAGNSPSRTVTIEDVGTYDILQFGAGITPASVSETTATVNGATVTTLSLGQQGTAIVEGNLNLVEFSNGLIVTPAQLAVTNSIVGSTDYSSSTTTLPAGLTNLVLTGAGNINGTANTGNDVLSANIGNDSLIAGAGNDTLNGGPGNDTLIGGHTTQMVSGNPAGFEPGATTFVVSQNSINVIYAGPKDILQLGAGVNPASLTVTQSTSSSGTKWTIATSNFSQTLYGTPASIAFPDGSVIPFRTFASGNFTEGTNQYSSLSTTMLPGMTKLSLSATGISGTGNNLNDTISGSTNDTLNAGSGNDVLIGESMGDVMNGGSGSTTYEIDENSALQVYAAPQGPTVTIGQSSANDTILVDMNVLVSPTNTDANVFLNEYDSELALHSITQNAVLLSNGQTQLTIDFLQLDVSTNGMVNQIHFADGSSLTVDQLLLANQANNISSSTGGAMPLGAVKVTLTGSASLSATGNALDDFIIGNSGNDILTAGTGSDTLLAGSGNDTLVAGSGKDSLEVAGGTATIQNGSYNDIITFTNNPARSNITASSATSNGVTTITITDSLGGKAVVTGGQAEVSFGPAYGIYTAAQLAGTATTVTSSSNVTLAGGVTNLTLTGSASLSATGNNLNDVITGNTGNDTLNAGTGVATTLIGGSGSDTFILTSQNDVITEAANSGNNTEVVSFYATLAPNVQNLAGSGSVGIALTGNNLAGTITANSGNDTLIAGSGAETMIGGAGVDQFNVGNANLTVVAGSGGGSINVGSGTLSLQNSTAATTLNYAGFGNMVPGNLSASTSVVNGTTVTTLTNSLGGKVVVNGGDAVISLLIGKDGNGNNILDNFTLSQLAGTAPVTTSAANVTLPGGVTNLTLTGNGNLTATGNNLNDVITGNAGNDTLNAGPGYATTLVGGTGNDTFVLTTSKDVITEAANSGSNTEVVPFSATLAANVQNLSASGSGTFSLTGNNLHNVITASDMYQTLTAGTGLATLVGASSGSDTFIVNNAGDVIQANGTGNAVQTSYSMTAPANVTNLVATANNLTLTANSGNDVLYASGNGETLVAGSGNDTLSGGFPGTTYVVNTGAGAVSLPNTGTSDVLQFGPGINAAQVTASTAVVNGNTVDTLTISGGKPVTITNPGMYLVKYGDGTTSYLPALVSPSTAITSAATITMPAKDTVLTLTGTASITATGNALADFIVANSGNDTLTAGSGAATLVGGTGNDTFIANNSADVIVEAPNNGNNTEQISAAVAFANNVQNLVATGSAALTLIGNNVSDVITANSGNDTMWGGGQGTAVTLIGGAGQDWFYGLSDGSKSTYEANTGNGNLNIDSAQANDILLFGTGITAASLSAATSVVGGNTMLTITESNGKTVTVNETDSSTAFNTAHFSDGTSATFAALVAQASSSISSAVSITMPAGVTKLTLTGTSSITGTGNTLADTIIANSGNDTLISGSGIDTLVGGSGNDTFVINNSSDAITVTTAKAGNVTQSTVSFVLPTNLLNLTGTSTGSINLTGNTLADTITANSGNDTLTSGSGIDTLVAGAGNDTFIINNSSDAITASTAKAGNVTQTNVSYVLPANLLNLTALGSASLALTGNASADIITANGGNDTLTAGAGLATLVGGAGNDTFVINSASDVITVSTAKAGNVVQSSVSYTLGANLMSLAGGGTGSISLTGNTLADTITANSGNDTLTAGSGIATLVGGAGNDTFIVNNSSDAITASTAKAGNVVQSTVSYVLPANLLSLTGNGSGNINLTGNTLADKITANSGNDTLTSGSGIDILVGGTGNDTFIINNSSDAITVSSAKAGNVVQSSVNYVLPTNLLSVAGTGTASISLTGNASANTITANSGNDTLTAGAGLATLIGGAGNDTFVVNNASDVITEAVNTGNNTESTSVAVTLAANVQNLVATGTTAIKLTGNSGTDVITGNSGNDTLASGSGNDTLIAGTGSTKTTMTGGAGNDTFVINNAGDTITATAGSNVNTVQTSVSFTAPTNVQDLFGTGSAAIALTGNTVNNLLIGNSGNDTLTAGSGITVIEAGSGTDVLKDTASANALIGGSGNDSMTGGTGASFIVGGAGNDAITLGAGTAVVAFNTGAGKATIAPGTGVSNVLSLGGGIAYANLAFSKSGNNLILSTGGNNTITLTNWYAATADQNFVTLQVIEQAAGTYSAASSNTLYSSEVEEFSFTQLVAAFNAALTANPSLTSWSLSNSLLTDHLSSSNTVALGGDLAYYDGLNGNVTGMNMATADTTLQSSTFGKTAQTIDAWSGISAGTNKLH